MAEGRQREKKTLESEFRWTAKRVSGLKRQGKGRTEGKASHDAVNLNDSPEDPKTMITLVAIPPIVGGRRHSYVNIRVAPEKRSKLQFAVTRYAAPSSMNFLCLRCRIVLTA